MSCSQCNSNRLMHLSAHAKDMFDWQIPHLGIDDSGYSPNIPEVCFSDDANITFCLDCGQIQNFKSVTDEYLLLEFDLESEDDDECENPSVKQGSKESDNYYNSIIGEPSMVTHKETNVCVPVTYLLLWSIFTTDHPQEPGKLKFFIKENDKMPVFIKYEDSIESLMEYISTDNTFFAGYYCNFPLFKIK